MGLLSLAPSPNYLQVFHVGYYLRIVVLLHLRFRFPSFQLPNIKWKILEQFISFTLCAILSSMMKSRGDQPRT